MSRRMLTPEYLKFIPEDLVKIYEEIEDEILKDIARRIKKTDYLTPTAERQSEVLISSGHDLNRLKKELKPLLNKASNELDRIIDESSLKHYEDEEKAYQQINKELGNYTANENIIKRVEAAKNQVKNEFGDLTNTLGIPLGNNYTVLDEFYKAELNKRIYMIQSGAFDSVSIARNLINQLTTEGIKFVNYSKSGRNYNIDSVVRMVLKTTLNQLTGNISLLNAKDMEQDLMEISAHMGARPSHAEWQGQIVSLSGRSEYLSLDGIGYGSAGGFMGVNCRHNWYPFFEELSKRNYTDEELENIDPEPFEFNGKEYSYYEATQKQRQIERSIRNNKRKIIMYNEINDKEVLTIASVRLQRQKELYNNFLKAGNLKGRSDYLGVSGYNKSVASKVYWADKRAKDIANSMYSLGSTKANVDAYLRDKPIRDKILNSINKTINNGKQGKHVIGHNNYIDGRSYLTINMEEAQKLVNKYAGTGEISRYLSGEWNNRELIIINDYIGVNINNKTGTLKYTNKFYIYYSETGVHVVPTLKGEKKWY